MSTFFGGFGVAFINGWKLTLVLLAMIPLLTLAGGAIKDDKPRPASICGSGKCCGADNWGNQDGKNMMNKAQAVFYITYSD